SSGPRAGRAHALEAKPGQKDRVAREPKGRERVGVERQGITDERREGSLVGRPVALQGPPGIGERTLEERGAPLVEGMREGHFGKGPGEAMVGEGQPLEEGRDERQRMDGGAYVVHEARQRELRGARSASHGGSALDEQNRQSGARAGDRRSEAVRAGADDHDVARPAHFYEGRRAMSS